MATSENETARAGEYRNTRSCSLIGTSPSRISLTEAD